MSILDTIKVHKLREIEALKARRSMPEIRSAAEAAPAPRGFADQLARRIAGGGFALIAEIKKASPSKGVIRPDFDVARIATAYRDGGAACLSVLTDTAFFQGEHDHLRQAQAASGLPTLRKDFLFDPVQVWESRALGADCILLILSSLDQSQANELEALALELGMDVLLETHDADELDRALTMRSRLIGINNRDLTTFEASLTRTETLAPRVGKDRLLVSESGIGGAGDLQRLSRAGVNSFLVGETLMRARDIRAATEALLGAGRTLDVHRAG